MRKYIFVIISLISSCLIAQQSSLDKRFLIVENLTYPSNFIEFPKKIDFSNSKLPQFEKEKIQYYLDYFLQENPKGLKQAMFRAKMKIGQNENEIMTNLVLSVSGCKGNFFNISFPIAAKYGLEMDEYIDERMDFVSNYRAADKWIAHLSKTFFIPEDVILAFVNSPGALKRAKKRAKSNVLVDYYSFLPETTRDDYFIYLAISEIKSKSKSLNINIRKTENFKILEVEKTFDLKVFEQVSGKSKSLITLLNPTLISDIVPQWFNLTYNNDSVPSVLDLVYFYQDSILNNPNYGKSIEDSSNLILTDIYYKIKKGDNLLMISNWYDVEINQLKVWNKLNSDDISAGQALKIWVNEEDAFDLSKISFLSLETKNELMEHTSYIEVLKDFKFYTVVKGDALWMIAKRYENVSANDIMNWNGISENIEIGQKILIKVEN